LASYNNHNKIKPFGALEAPFCDQNGTAKPKNCPHF